MRVLAPENKVMDEDTAEEKNLDALSITLAGRGLGVDTRRYTFLSQSARFENAYGGYSNVIDIRPFFSL